MRNGYSSTTKSKIVLPPYGAKSVRLKRRRAIKTAVEALRPLIGAIQHHHGLPVGFWNDPYIVGFFTAMAGQYAKLSTKGRITGSDLGFALATTLTALSKHEWRCDRRPHDRTGGSGRPRLQPSGRQCGRHHVVSNAP